MKVKKLIALLERAPKEATVYTGFNDGYGVYNLTEEIILSEDEILLVCE